MKPAICRRGGEGELAGARLHLHEIQALVGHLHESPVGIEGDFAENLDVASHHHRVWDDERIRPTTPWRGVLCRVPGEVERAQRRILEGQAHFPQACHLSPGDTGAPRPRQLNQSSHGQGHALNRGGRPRTAGLRVRARPQFQEPRRSGWPSGTAQEQERQNTPGQPWPRGSTCGHSADATHCLPGKSSIEPRGGRHWTSPWRAAPQSVTA